MTTTSTISDDDWFDETYGSSKGGISAYIA